MLREIQKEDIDKPLADDARFFLANALARTGQKDEATKIFKDIVAENGRFVTTSKAALAALETGTELPAMPGSPKPAAKPQPPAAPQPAQGP